MPETYELHQLLGYVKKVAETYNRPIVVPSELADMLVTVNSALDKLQSSGYQDAAPGAAIDRDVPADLFDYWDTVATARESYRSKVAYYFSGNTTEYSAQQIVDMTSRWLGEVELGMERAIRVGSQGDGDDG
jgi:hypothetical protein